MRIALINLPWTHPSDNLLWGVRAGSRWPHFQRRPASGKLPRYIPFPFFLAIAAGECKRNGHIVKLIDGVASDITIHDLISTLSDFKPQIIFCETSTPSFFHDLALMKELQNIFHCPVAAAGTHAPHLAARTIKTEGFPNYWLCGEYERTLPELLNQLEGCGTSTPAIPGVIQPEDLTITWPERTDVNTLAAPVFEQLPMTSYGDPVCGLPTPGCQTWLSRGCPYNCSFCVWPQLIYQGRHYRTRDIPMALDEVETWINQYQAESFYFDDDTANIGENRMTTLAEEIKARQLDKIPWAMMARADCMTEKMLDALADAGIYSIKYGIESSAPQLRDVCNKATNWEKLEQAINLTRERNIKMHLTFTFGLPGETSRTIQESADFCCGVAPETAQFSLCTPFPGTVFFDDAVKHNWLTTQNWEQFLGSSEAVISTPHLSSKELLSAYQKACDQWNQFVANRLNNRKESLKKHLKELTANNRCWHVEGDTDMADFLRRDPELASREQHKAPDSLPVILSRHDEEKIRRRLQRNPMYRKRAIPSLYQDRD